MNVKYLEMFPTDIVKEIFNKLPVEKTFFRPMARFGRTCRSYQIISAKLIFERMIELEPTVIYDIQCNFYGGGGYQSIAESFYFPAAPNITWPIQAFKSIIKVYKKYSSDLGHLFSYIALGLKSSEQAKVKSALSILKFVLDQNWNRKLIGDEFIKYRDAIVKGLKPTLDDYFDMPSHANFCLLYIVDQKLITIDAICTINCIIQKITDLITNPNYLIFKNTKSFQSLLNILSQMFEQALVDENLPSFNILSDNIAAFDGSQNFFYGSQNFFLRLCRINQSLKDAVLPRYSKLVAEAILREGCTQSWAYRVEDLFNFLKYIIDLETSANSECCQLIMKAINYRLTRYVGKTYIKFQNLQYYIYYKNSWFPISWENYQMLFRV